MGDSRSREGFVRTDLAMSFLKYTALKHTLNFELGLGLSKNRIKVKIGLNVYWRNAEKYSLNLSSDLKF